MSTNAFELLKNSAKQTSNRPTKSRSVQRDLHVCIRCKKTLSRGNLATRQRHASTVHKDEIYDCRKEILKADHIKAVGIIQENEKTKISSPMPSSSLSRNENSSRLHSSAIGFVDPDDASSSDTDNDSDIEECGVEPKEACSIQPTIESFNQEPSTEKKATKSDTEEIMKKLNMLIEKMDLETQNKHLDPLTAGSANTVEKIRQASSLADINETDFEFFHCESKGEGGIVRCKVCFSMNNHDNTTTEMVKKTGSNVLATGIEISKERLVFLMSGSNQTWYSFKSMLVEHAGCSTTRNGGMMHYKALIAYKKRQKLNAVIEDVVSNQLKSALHTVKVKSAAIHYEDTIGLLHSCGANVGNLGHSRTQFKEMIRTFQGYIHLKTRELLTTRLPSTGLPPHFSTTSDKSTPSQVSNHAILILLMVHGKKYAIPVDAPPVYKYENAQISGGKAADLADQVVQALLTNVKLPGELLSSLVAHHADGQYQAKQFHARLQSITETSRDADIDLPVVPSERDTFFVVPWDTAHWLDCGMTDIREKSSEGEILRRFIKRANKFHHMFGRGRGYTEYKGFAEENQLKSHVIQAYSTTRFASSSFSQFKSIYTSYEALVRAFDTERETNDENEEMKYIVRGRDFCIDLCGLIDLLEPVMRLMEMGQQLNQQLWSITKLWPKVKAIYAKIEDNLAKQIESTENICILNKELFPKLCEHFDFLTSEDIEGCRFQNVKLYEGWLVEKDACIQEGGSKKRKRVIEWACRQPSDCFNELKSLSRSIVNVIEKRYKDSVSDAAHILGQCFHLPDIVRLLVCGNCKLSAEQLFKYEGFGEDAFKAFFKYVCSLQHIQKLARGDDSLRFLPGLSNNIYRGFKQVIKDVVFDNFADLRTKWFPSISGTHGTVLECFKVDDGGSYFEDKYIFQYVEGTCRAKLDVSVAHASFYGYERLYQRVGQEFCIALDIALSMGGSEAVVESYYSVMKSQQMSGGQTNDTLVHRTNVDWCFPMPAQCHHTIKDVASLYVDGNVDMGLPRHRTPVFIDKKGRTQYQYMFGSKVLDKLFSKSKSVILNDNDK